MKFILESDELALLVRHSNNLRNINGRISELQANKLEEIAILEQIWKSIYRRVQLENEEFRKYNIINLLNEDGSEIQVDIDLATREVSIDTD